MKMLFYFLIMLLIGIPLFAVFQLLHRLEHNPIDKNSEENFYNALRAQYGLDSKEEKEEPKRTLTAQERIELAKRISEDPFADVKASDVMEELPEDETENTVPEGSVSENSAPEIQKPEISEPKADSDNAADMAEKPAEGKMTREQAIALVSGMLGSDKKKKGSAYASLQETLAKYQNNNNSK